MKRSDLLYVMSLGRGGVPDASALRNSRALRRALANREHSAACAGAGGDECGCSCGGSMHGGGQSGDIGTLKSTKVSAINVSPGGRTFVGFTDRSTEPPRNHYLPVGGEEDGWRVVSADYDSEEAVLEKDGRRIAVKLGGVPEEAAPEEEEPGPESGGDIRNPPDTDGEGFDLGGAWEDFLESGIWSMRGSNREGILDDIRERYDQEGEDALGQGERKFLEQYGKWESVQSMAEAREGERRAGVPYEYEGSLADGYLENRRGCGRRRRRLANRVEAEALRRLANIGWTDEARAASIAARRANAEARNAVGAAAGVAGGVRGIFAPPHRGTPIDPAKHVYPMPPGHMPPATDGTLVKTGDSVMLILNGKPVRIGSAKVLSLGPDGNLLLKTRAGSVDLGRPGKWGGFTGSKGLFGGFVRVGGEVFARVGDALVSLENGGVKRSAVIPRTNTRGVVSYELPSRAGLGLKV